MYEMFLIYTKLNCRLKITNNWFILHILYFECVFSTLSQIDTTIPLHKIRNHKKYLFWRCFRGGDQNLSLHTSFAYVCLIFFKTKYFPSCLQNFTLKVVNYGFSELTGNIWKYQKHKAVSSLNMFSQLVENNRIETPARVGCHNLVVFGCCVFVLSFDLYKKFFLIFICCCVE